MNKTIPKNIANYTLITPDKLPAHALSSKEKELLFAFIKKHNQHNKKGIFLLFAMGLAFALLCIYNGIFDISACIFCAIFIIIAFAISRKLLPSAESCQYIAIGQLHGIWSIRNNGSRNRIYYFDVIFPDSNTYIKNVISTKTEYSKAKEGDSILTFSFDGRTTYGCLFK